MINMIERQANHENHVILSKNEGTYRQVISGQRAARPEPRKYDLVSCLFERIDGIETIE